MKTETKKPTKEELQAINILFSATTLYVEGHLNGEEIISMIKTVEEEGEVNKKLIRRIQYSLSNMAPMLNFARDIQKACGMIQKGEVTGVEIEVEVKRNAI